MTLAVIILSGVLAAVVVDDLDLRRRIRKRKREDAKATVAALGNTVLVDGIQLPKPNDERWELKDFSFEITAIRNNTAIKKKENRECLALGPVVVDDKTVHVNRQALCGAQAIKYAERCWAAYHSRAVRKAVDL